MERNGWTLRWRRELTGPVSRHPRTMATEPRYTTSIDINTPAERVYEVMIDIDRWHEWTPSISSIKRLDGTAFELGKRVMIRQPKLPPAMWTISRIDPNRRFEWVNRSPGLKVTGHHSVEPTANGSRATLALNYQGIFGGL